MPPESERAFAFKVIPEPTPLAETLATGTIYVSTGLISLLDSEAQLAYVLAHEAAHVQLDHWRERVKLECGQKAYNDEQAVKVKKPGLLGGLLGSALGAGLGGSGSNAVEGGLIRAAAGVVGGLLFERPLIVNWDKVEEDAADEYALKRVLEAAYDVREVPNLYVAMQKVALRDTRVGLGFLGNRRRIEQRLEKAKTLLAGAYKADIETKLKTTGFLSTSAEHRNLMAELKRDNGIMAYYHDMFDLARVNLYEATAIRENDPAAHYYYAKVMKLIGRTEEDQKLARDEFNKAAKYDRHDENFGSHLHLAMMISREKDPDKKQITQQLDEYVTDYAQWNVTDRVMRAFPPNLETIYEYMTLYDDPGWAPKPPNLSNLPLYQAVNALYSNGIELPPGSPIPPSSNPAPGRGQPARGPSSLIPGMPTQVGVPVPGTKITVPVPVPVVKKN
jgi:predicted Zn-dependent protease